MDTVSRMPIFKIMYPQRLDRAFLLSLHYESVDKEEECRMQEHPESVPEMV